MKKLIKEITIAVYKNLASHVLSFSAWILIEDRQANIQRKSNLSKGNKLLAAESQQQIKL